MPPSPKIEQLLKSERIGKLKLPEAVECSKDTSLEDAISIMRERKSGYIVVAENKKVLGIFTEKDLTLNVLGTDANFKDPVSKFMNSNIQVLTLDDVVGRAVDMMHDYEYRHIVLVDDQKNLAGVISARAIIRFLAEHYPAEVLNLPPKSDQISETREGG